MEERWKEVVIRGFEGLYEVSDRGQVRKRNGELVETKDITAAGVQRVTLYSPHTKAVRNVRVARLVFQTFSATGCDGQQIGYLDNNPQNRAFSNLYLKPRVLHPENDDVPEDTEAFVRALSAKIFADIAPETITALREHKRELAGEKPPAWSQPAINLPVESDPENREVA
jgi:hypothetical protein